MMTDVGMYVPAPTLSSSVVISTHIIHYNGADWRPNVLTAVAFLDRLGLMASPKNWGVLFDMDGTITHSDSTHFEVRLPSEGYLSNELYVTLKRKWCSR